MTQPPEHGPTLVHHAEPEQRDAPLPSDVMAVLLMEVHAGLMADERFAHLTAPIEEVLFELVSAARAEGDSQAKPIGKTLTALKLIK